MNMTLSTYKVQMHLACAFCICLQGRYKRIWKQVEVLQLNGGGRVSRLYEEEGNHRQHLKAHIGNNFT